MEDNKPHSDTLFDAASESCADDRINTPPSSIYGSTHGDKDQFMNESRTLQPGHNYIIQSVPCGRLMTLLHGKVILDHYDTLGSIYWTCVESEGWLGLRNAASGKLLRHGGGQPGLDCSNHKLATWERLQIRPHGVADKGYTILMEYWGNLKPVGTRVVQGEELLDRLVTTEGEALAWVFFEVNEAKRG